MVRRLFVLVITVILTLTTLPITVLAYDSGGNTYNNHDYNAIKNFLNQTSANGTDTNGLQLNTLYDPLDPATWSGVCWTDPGDGELHVQYIYFNGRSLAGSLDMSGCTALKQLICYTNQLTAINVTGCSSLEQLSCAENKLTTIDVSSLSNLEYFWCDNNNLTSINISGCVSLEQLLCSKNQLTSLDVSGCPALQYLVCTNNQLTSLDASGHTALINLVLFDNQLTSLKVSGCSALYDLDCYNNKLTTIDASGLSSLVYLTCKGNNLTTLNVAGCTLLTYFTCYENHLITLDTSGLSNLQLLNCNHNSLTTLNVSGCTALNTLDCSENQLTALGVTSPVGLTGLICTGNPLKQLHACLNGHNVSVTNAGNGSIELYRDLRYYYVQVYPVETESFYNWTDSGSEASTDKKFNLDSSRDYDLTANFLSLASSVPDGRIYTGGRITLAPSIDGGTWSLNPVYFSQDGNDFKGLKAGSSVITYTLNGVSVTCDVTILESELPNTGQDIAFMYLLGGFALLSLGAGVASSIMSFRKREKSI